MGLPKRVQRDFFKRWNASMAYVVGFFAADGSMVETTRGGYFIDFHITDREILAAIRRAIHSNHRISVRKKRKANHRTGYRLQIGSKEWFSDLSRLGFTARKSNSLRMPIVPRAFLSHFIRGYFDGDGCVYFKRLKFADRKRTRFVLQSLFTCGSVHFLTALHRLLRLRGVQGGSLKKKKRGYELVLSHHDSVALYGIMYNNLRDSDIYLARKYRLFTRAIETLYGNALRP